MNYTIEGVTLAVRKMDKMLTFYQELFRIEFRQKEMFGSTLYAGQWGNMKLLFCPAELAQNMATQNRHQFDVVVDDLDSFIEKTKHTGGSLLGDVVTQDGFKSIGVYDPDMNTMVFKQLLTT